MSTTKNKVVKVVTFTLEYDADFPIPTNEDLYEEARSAMHNFPPMFEGDDEKLVNWQCEVTDFVAPDAEEPVSLGPIDKNPCGWGFNV